MTVAAVAYRLLTPAARDRARALLRLNPDYARWVAGIARARPDADRDVIIFMRAATWADAIKLDPRYVNDPGDAWSAAVAAAAVSEQPGYHDHRQHRYWHFIDVPLPADEPSAAIRIQEPRRPNAETQIAVFRDALRSASASEAVKSYSLVWLLHLVGDVHQPLHCVSRFDRSQPRGDRGGNAVLLCAAPCTDVLHGFWDGVAGGSEDPDDAMAQAAQLPPADPRLAVIDSASTWVAESFTLARQSVYVAPIGRGAGPFTLDARYQNQARRIALLRLALAGARLAQVINHDLVR
jgi:hypothetical protein